MMGFFPETFNKEERCPLPALFLTFYSLFNLFIFSQKSSIMAQIKFHYKYTENIKINVRYTFWLYIYCRCCCLKYFLNLHSY